MGAIKEFSIQYDEFNRHANRTKLIMLTELEKRYDWRVEWDDMPGLNTILDEWLTTVEASDQIGITRTQVSRLCLERSLKSVKINGIWRISPDAPAHHKKGKWRHK